MVESLQGNPFFSFQSHVSPFRVKAGCLERGEKPIRIIDELSVGGGRKGQFLGFHGERLAAWHINPSPRTLNSKASVRICNGHLLRAIVIPCVPAPHGKSRFAGSIFEDCIFRIGHF